MKYRIHLYNRRGDRVGTRYAQTLAEAEAIRTAHAQSIGLEPEPTTRHFALYPTIWELTPSGYRRVLGY